MCHLHYCCCQLYPTSSQSSASRDSIHYMYMYRVLTPDLEGLKLCGKVQCILCVARINLFSQYSLLVTREIGHSVLKHNQYIQIAPHF
jgi:hypothetical protein